MKVSIAMATYNGEKYLQEQLDSFLAQNRLPDELVVCDDCSTDGTVRILDNFAKNAPFNVLVINNEKNLGYTQNFAKAINLCTGDLVFISDQDDVWFSKKIQKIEEFFQQNHHIRVVINNQIITNERLEHKGVTKLENIRLAGLSESFFMTGCCSCIRKDFIPVLSPIPLSVPKYDFWIHEIANLLEVKSIMPEPLQWFRRHPQNTSSWIVSRSRKLGILDLILDRVQKTLKKVTNPNDYYENLLNRIAYLENIQLRLIDTKLKELLPDINEKTWLRAIEQLEERKRGYIFRQEIYKCHFFKRIFLMTKFLIFDRHEEKKKSSLFN